MATDNSKLIYNSTWDIDQLIVYNSGTHVGASPSWGDGTALTTFSGNPPVFELQFKPDGYSSWFPQGANSYDNNNGFYVSYAYIIGNTIYIYNDIAGTARYWIWSDRINY